MNYFWLSAYLIGLLALVLECLPVLHTYVYGEQVVQALSLSSILSSSVLNRSPFGHSWVSITRAALFSFLLWTGMSPHRQAFE